MWISSTVSRGTRPRNEGITHQFAGRDGLRHQVSCTRPAFSFVTSGSLPTVLPAQHAAVAYPTVASVSLPNIDVSFVFSPLAPHAFLV